MYNNIYETGRHMGNYGYGAFPYSPAVFWGLSILGLIVAVWFLISLVLKGYALWNAAKRNEKWWFIALLVVNTMGILELIYLIFVVKIPLCKRFGGHQCCGRHCHCGECDTCKSEGKVICALRDKDSEDMDIMEEEASPENKENTKKEAEEVF